jgi:hypothetical protein
MKSASLFSSPKTSFHAHSCAHEEMSKEEQQGIIKGWQQDMQNNSERAKVLEGLRDSMEGSAK